MWKRTFATAAMTVALLAGTAAASPVPSGEPDCCQCRTMIPGPPPQFVLTCFDTLDPDAPSMDVCPSQDASQICRVVKRAFCFSSGECFRIPHDPK